MSRLLSWHRPGQKVVCHPYDAKTYVDNAEVLRSYGIESPVVGHVYTVRAVEVFNGEVGFRFKEVCNRVRFYLPDDIYGEHLFGADDFRPVRSTSIDCFHSLLNPSPDTKRELEKELAR